MSNPLRPFRRKSLRAAIFVALPALTLLARPTALRADDEPPPVPEEEVFRSNTDKVMAQAAALAGAGSQGGRGFGTVFGLLIQGDRLRLWTLEQSEHAIPLRSGKGSPLAGVKDHTELHAENDREAEAYCEALLKASYVSPGALANSARRDVSFAELYNEPWRYRGDVIHFEGKLRRVTALEIPAMLKHPLESRGVKTLYECWLFDTRHGVNPVCLVCSELPDGVAPADHLSLVADFDAYFFKRYRYESADSKPGHAREAPLFLGRTFEVPAAPPPEPDAFAVNAKAMLLLFLGAVLAVVVAAFGLHWWFHRGDHRLRAKLKEVRAREGAAPPPAAGGLPGTTPSAN